jgi:hypothetical protein
LGWSAGAFLACVAYLCCHRSPITWPTVPPSQPWPLTAAAKPGLCAGEGRYRHNRVICAHLVLIATLNRFGDDFQKTDGAEMSEVISNVDNPVVHADLKVPIKQARLDHDPEFSRLIGLLPNT